MQENSQLFSKPPTTPLPFPLPGAGLGVVLRPDALGMLPGWARSLFGSGVVTGTVAVLAAQAILGRTPEEEEGG